MLLQKLRCPLVQGAYFIVWVITRDNIKKNVIAFFEKRELLSISSQRYIFHNSTLNSN